MDELIMNTAYSIGAILGDGHMRFVPGPNGNHWQVELAGMDLEIIERFLDEVNKVFGKSYGWFSRKLKSGIDFYYARTYSKIVYDYFHTLTKCRTEVPIEIPRGSDQVRRDFLAGLFDTDGTVKLTETWNGSRTKKNPRWQLGFSNTKICIVESAAAILQSLGVRVGKIHTYHRNSYRTIYSIHPNIRTFLASGCYFTASRKQDRLNMYLAHVVGSETMHTAPMTMGEDIVRGVAKTTL